MLTLYPLAAQAELTLQPVLTVQEIPRDASAICEFKRPLAPCHKDSISLSILQPSAQALFHSYQWGALLDKNGIFNCLKSSSQKLPAGTMALV